MSQASQALCHKSGMYTLAVQAAVSRTQARDARGHQHDGDNYVAGRSYLFDFCYSARAVAWSSLRELKSESLELEFAQYSPRHTGAEGHAAPLHNHR